jgi:hypothetical protein
VVIISIRSCVVTIGAVVVSHNSADDLPACIEALLGAAAVERVVVVDNASQDQSCELVRSFDDPEAAIGAIASSAKISSASPSSTPTLSCPKTVYSELGSHWKVTTLWHASHHS